MENQEQSKTTRKSIGLKKRFNIFERDNFTCQYCGKTPPNCVLEIDHVIPVSKNGTNDDINLLTSCFECNRGKKTKILSNQKMNDKINSDIELMKEKEKQLKSYYAYLKKIKDVGSPEVDIIEEVFQEYFPNIEFTNNFRNSLSYFLEHLTVEFIIKAMRKSANKCYSYGHVLRYFCGICHNTIRSNKCL